MYQYYISEGMYEDFGECDLFHEKSFSNEEFKNMIFESIINIKNKNEEYNTMEDLIKEMILTFGFYEFEATQRVHISDWGIDYVKLIEDLK